LLHGKRPHCHIAKSYCLDVEHLSGSGGMERTSALAAPRTNEGKGFQRLRGVR
jgi:hypothetical protein